ncbi:YciI family protein [Amphiplicatus metriothermophilus]|uniref:Uncharacterized conserved protein YciI, contains a putative active-site phosphohistidine n=1 Tax=Amphiplicatus metriothermophilus TaxID=1519374 RepID=A0A239PJX6_9PROT|nr:YciI family protein [Amphiplicatus metriothermophilus]MBB5518037.1 uncharacterized protein YciI [Amphiplicatus metriothermophilus]SNT67629.1 Uncharacterized conserved protein YciI, contains a putative active-site phosphohistidine [Amphiplicatus metriothermophilus]
MSKLVLSAMLAIAALGLARAAAENAAAQPERALFIFAYSPGPAWVEGKPMREQNLLPHGRYIRSLLDEGRIFAAGGYADADGGVALVWAQDRAEAERLLAADPAIVEGVFTAEIRAWAPRFVSGETLQPIIAPR